MSQLTGMKLGDREVQRLHIISAKDPTGNSLFMTTLCSLSNRSAKTTTGHGGMQKLTSDTMKLRRTKDGASGSEALRL